MHLAVIPDIIVAILCDLSDGPRREADLQALHASYKSWCDEQGVPDRASRKLFTSGILRPGSKEYVGISQKICNASAARYFIFWLAQYMAALAQSNPGNEWYMNPGVFFCCFYQ
ncbi:unnamed protein product [Symbiodinium natans]|uniref:Uncharacterized protein n=1 Tax=Symbiodinium natans TaxID=878477 RepID=A0A812UIF4_9DINO|nr:unnamed protein product [Symbiodinium natans]